MTMTSRERRHQARKSLLAEMQWMRCIVMDDDMAVPPSEAIRQSVFLGGMIAALEISGVITQGSAKRCRGWVNAMRGVRAQQTED